MVRHIGAVSVVCTCVGGAWAQCSGDWELGRHFGYPGSASLHTLTYDTSRGVAVFFRFNYSDTPRPLRCGNGVGPAMGLMGVSVMSRGPRGASGGAWRLTRCVT